ncbi:hypothetical protein C8R46DRAFT_213930 [Mycena filopes]|nr:hypothetical protein C8R46DRAFT_213930 [Mycena filopes]
MLIVATSPLLSSPVKFCCNMTNAFPCTDIETVGGYVRAARVSGPFFDLMCMLYARMSYAVKFGDEHSLPFRSLIGLFTGDSASPTLRNIYFSDFRLPPHEDDVRLNGRPVSQAEQADDNLTMSPAFQAKVTMFFKWGNNKRTFVGAKKFEWMIFGPLPSVIPVLRIGNLIVKLVYMGVQICRNLVSIHANVFARHYAAKASKARGAANAIFALKHRVGTMPVKEGIQLYMARVDCYLISGCELALDTAAGLLDVYVDVQHTFLRRLLGLNSHSMLAILFTETGQMPLRIRRILLALGRLRYMVMVEEGCVVCDALLDSIALLCEGKSGWATDLVIMLRRLPTPIDVTFSGWTPSPPSRRGSSLYSMTTCSATSTGS